MTEIKRYKTSIERFLSGEKGQRFFNFAYSIGAAIVIWGALFKILHLPGGSTLLCIGMGTEVLMFILTAFDRPAKEYHWENVFPALDPQASAQTIAEAQEATAATMPLQTTLQGTTAVPVQSAGQTVIIGSGAAPIEASGISHTPAINPLDIPLTAGASPIEATEHYVAQVAALGEQMAELRRSTEALNEVSRILLDSYRAITENSSEINSSSSGYVQEMTSLNRNISGLNTIYEIQLKSVSSQLDSIDRVNRGIKDIRDMYEKSAETSAQYCEETEKMARYMQQLNSVYEKMIHAMTLNMMVPGAAAAPTRQSTSDQQQTND